MVSFDNLINLGYGLSVIDPSICHLLDNEKFYHDITELKQVPPTLLDYHGE